MNRHRCTPEQVLLRKEHARYRERYKCAACLWRPKLVGGLGNCGAKGRYAEGGRCGFSFDSDADVRGV